MRTKAGEYKRVRKKVVKRDDYKCVLCGKSLLSGNDIMGEIHHVIFRSHNGLNKEQNLVSLCYRCHRELAHGPNAKKIQDILLDYLYGKYKHVTKTT